MPVSSESEICNMSLNLLGNFGTVSDIRTPTNDKERTFAIWYDICRQFVLKMLMPNFALARSVVGQLAETPAFGYAFYYEYPITCLKVLGIGNIQDKENNYAIEGNKIAHDYDYTDGMPIRFIVDVTDLNQWSVEAKMLLAQYLAAYVALPITQDINKAAKLKAELPAQISAASGLNAQENMPVRLSRSRFKEARYNDRPTNTDKK